MTASTIRYVVLVNVKETKPSVIQYKVEDTKENRTICYCTFVRDADRIAKAMNVSDSWEPITIRGET